jgi:LDH2 family malate/lactate/ureidoglycolate dehydrogenase
MSTSSPHAPTPRARVPADVLADFAARVLRALEVKPDEASLVADSLVQADLWGHQSHGLLRLPWYADRIRSGAMRVHGVPEPLVDTGPLLLLDGKHGIGQALTERARVESVRRAKAHGVGVVAVRNSNHFGAAMYFTRRAAAEGCVSILTTNSSPAMAPWGGREKVLGANPWSIAAPWGDRVVVVDVSNTAVARGKIYLARQRGESIPESWALNQDGFPTTDPDEAIRGIMLPMAGHKGYAITFMMDVLSGALTGSSVGLSVSGPYVPDKESGVGHLFIAIDVETLGSAEEFRQRVGTLVSETKSAPLAAGFDRISYPGELEDESERRQRAAGGVALPQQTWQDLSALADGVGISMPGGGPDA